MACSAETLSGLGDDVQTIDPGAIAVKGSGEPVRCFQMDRIGQTANPSPAPPPDAQVTKAAVAGYH